MDPVEAIRHLTFMSDVISHSYSIGRKFDGIKMTEEYDKALALTRDFKLRGENPVNKTAIEQATEALREAIRYGGSDAVIVYITTHSTSDDQFDYLSTLIPFLGFSLEADETARQLIKRSA